MKKIFVIASLFVAMVSAFAQNVTVTEPEFINAYFVLTSDSTSQLLPKEMGTVGAHVNKVKKISNKGNMCDNIADTKLHIQCSHWMFPCPDYKYENIKRNLEKSI